MTDDVLASLDRRELATMIERHADGLRAAAVELSAAIESGSEPSTGQVGAVRTELEEFAGVVEAVVGGVESDPELEADGNVDVVDDGVTAQDD